MIHRSPRQPSLSRLRALSLTHVVFIAFFACVIALSACSEIQRPVVRPYFAGTGPPQKQKLRWSNGKMPTSLDPALASTAPETDLVRALFDGLTDLDSRSLRAIPAIAEKWESSEDKREWTFTLRTEARWSNGESITAEDFVRSWQRLVTLRDKAANRFLFQNIVGMQDTGATPGPSDVPGDFLHSTPPESAPQTTPAKPEPFLSPTTRPSPNDTGTGQPNPGKTRIDSDTVVRPAPPVKLGVEALDKRTLRVGLVLPDKDFPKLVANPIFRPVYGRSDDVKTGDLNTETVTSGSFRISDIAEDTITVERDETHWNSQAIALESVQFVAATAAEAALDAYKKGEVDVVTNATFEPVALKILTPYEDFRRTAHSALNFYEVNISKAPFSDRRVREALAISIDRTKLTEGDLEGMMRPAANFYPVSEGRVQELALDIAKAKQLLETAGYANGKSFPVIRLVVNRNDTQQRVARSVARMWQQNLNLETNIIVKETSEIESVRESGDFDLLRRGVVLPANDEIVNLASIFGSASKPVVPPVNPGSATSQQPLPSASGPANAGPSAGSDARNEQIRIESKILTEADVIFDLRAIPLYFPTSYALVKPYVRGFELNGLDAPSLREVSIDTSWRPKAARTEP